jgi:hypothetical protein
LVQHHESRIVERREPDCASKGREFLPALGQDRRDGERPWPVVGHWDSVEEWRVSGGELGLRLVDISYWMAIPEIPTSPKMPYPEEADE